VGYLDLVEQCLKMYNFLQKWQTSSQGWESRPQNINSPLALQYGLKKFDKCRHTLTEIKNFGDLTILSMETSGILRHATSFASELSTPNDLSVHFKVGTRNDTKSNIERETNADDDMG
jgi:hypothetical protein